MKSWLKQYIAKISSILQHPYINNIQFSLNDIIRVKSVKVKPFIKAQQFLILIVPINFSLLYFLKNFLTFRGFEPQFLIKLFLIKKTKCIILIHTLMSHTRMLPFECKVFEISANTLKIYQVSMSENAIIISDEGFNQRLLSIWDC